MTVFIIIAAVLVLLVSLLFLPVSFHLKFEDGFFVKIKVAGIGVYSVKPGDDIKTPEPTDTESDVKAEKQTENAFKKLEKKLGFTGAVKELFAFIKAVLKRLKGILKHLYFKKLRLGIRVASGDAAYTAIQYGAVCSAVYPVLALIDTSSNVQMKEIDISADFKAESSEIAFAVIVKMRIIFLIRGAFALLSEYNNFKLRNEL